MVAQFFRLRFALLANTFRHSAAQRLGIILGILVSTALTVITCIFVVGLRLVNAELARTTIVIGGSIVVLAFVVVPLVLRRVDAMDPRRFAFFGIPARRLSFDLFVSSFAGWSAIAVSLVSLATIVAWSRGIIEVFFSVVGAALAALTCVLAGRVMTSVAAFLLATRRAREVASLIGVFALLILAPGMVLALSMDWGGQGATWTENLTQNLGWTPFGSAWSLPADALREDWPGIFFKLLIAVSTVVILWQAWRALVAVMLLTVEHEEEVAVPAGLGWFGRLPSTPTGGIAARSLTYWVRDPRYFVGLMIVPIIPIVMMIPLIIVEVPFQYLALFPLPVMCLFLGFTVHNDVAFDNSAVWLHIVSGQRGFADRVGRIVPVLAIGLPLIGIGSVISVFLANEARALPSVLGVSICLLLSALGLGSVASSRFPYPTTRPGDSPFTQPQSTGSSSAFVQVFVLLGTIIIAAPSIILAIFAELSNPELHWASLQWGVGVGVVVVVIGVVLGGTVFNHRAPEIMDNALRS